MFLALLIPIGVEAAPDDVEGAPQVPQVNVARFQMDDANFDANVFQPSGNEQGARAQIDSKLKVQLEEMNRICGLTEDQKKKLKLAASSDVKRFFDEVAAIRKKLKPDKLDQNAWNNMWQDIQPLRTRISNGLFGDASFFAKAIRKTLSDEQFVKYETVTTERRKFRYRASIEVVLTSMAPSVPLRRNQHDAIVKILLDETKAPQAFGQNDQNLVMYQLGKVPEAKLKPLFDDRQWNQLQQHLNQYRGMEQFLIQQGLIPKEDAEVKVLKARVRKRVVAKDAPANADEPENRGQEHSVP